MKTILLSFIGIFFILAINSCSDIEFLKTKTPKDRIFYQIQEEELIEPQEEIKTLEQFVKIGMLVPLSGQHEKIGEMLFNSAQLAVFESKNKNLVLVPFDTKATSFGAIEAMKNAVADEVDVVIGPLFTTSAKAIINIANEKDITVLSFSNNQELMDNGIYLMGFSPEQEIERIVSYTILENKVDFVGLVPNNKYGASISKILKDTISKKDGNLIKVEYYSPDGKGIDKNIGKINDAYGIMARVYDEYEQERQLAIEEGRPVEEVKFIVEEEDKIYPSVVLIPESGKKLNYIIEKLGTHNKNNEAYQYIGTSQWDTYSTFTNKNLVNSWFVAPDPEKYNKFEKKFYATYGTFPIRIASIPYDAVMVIDEVVNKDKDYLISKATLTKHNGFKGVDGKFRFLTNGLVQRMFTVLRVDEGGIEIIDEPNRNFLDY
ncbi:penicillin-binding protein activator [Pseudomonadota bacterium]